LKTLEDRRQERAEQKAAEEHAQQEDLEARAKIACAIAQDIDVDNTKARRTTFAVSTLGPTVSIRYSGHPLEIEVLSENSFRWILYGERGPFPGSPLVLDQDHMLDKLDEFLEHLARR